MSEASSSSLPVSAHASAKRALAARLAETMRGTAHEADVSGTANMLYELLLIVHSAQVAYGRQRARVSIKHRILHAAESETLTLEINHVDVLGTSELEALRRFAGANYGSTRFEFRSPATDELLSHGRVVLRLGVVSERRASESDGAFDERQRAKRDARQAQGAPALVCPRRRRRRRRRDANNERRDRRGRVRRLRAALCQRAVVYRQRTCALAAQVCIALARRHSPLPAQAAL